MNDNQSNRSKMPRRRFIVQPRYQIQFAILLVIFQFNMGVVYQGIMQMRIRQLAEEAGSLRNFMTMNLWNEVLPWMLGVSAAVSVLVYMIGLYFSNTIVGPVPRLRKTLQQLADGDYTPRLKFRPGDALEDLADDVNHLAVSLQEREAAHQAAIADPEAAPQHETAPDPAPEASSEEPAQTPA